MKYGRIAAAMSQPPPPEMPVTVGLAEARATSFWRETVVVGSVISQQSVQLRNEVTGLVTGVYMKPGGVVRAGETLVQLDDRVEKAELRSAAASLTLAVAALQRSQQLSRSNASTEQELDIARADAQRAEAEVERLKTMIDRKKIVARFDARVGLFDLHEGQYLEQGTEITTLEGVADSVHIDFTIPAHVADGIRIEDLVKIRYNEDAPVLTAIIVALDSRADPVSRSLMARARLDHPPETLLPGDAVRVTVPYGSPIEAVEIPATSIRRGATGTKVYVASKDSASGTLRAVSQEVQVVGGGGTLARVVAGLKPGDQVVSDGSFKVRDGSLLVPAPDTQASAGNVAEVQR